MRWQWKKLGHLFCPAGEWPWMKSHAATPTALQLEQDIFRVFFTCRDSWNRSHIAYLDLDFANNFKVINISQTPLIGPGQAGMFDDSGTACGHVLSVGEKIFLYYLGWNLKLTVPWMNTIGLAIAEFGTFDFKKASRAPLLDRSDEDPFSLSYPFVLFDSGIYRMWYGSNMSWGKNEREMQHVIKYAESNDGLKWQRTNRIAIDLIHPGEFAVARPWVVKNEDNYLMWYSYRGGPRGDNYRIGFANSRDGLTWARADDAAGIDVAKSGWDSTMIEYPCVFSHRGLSYMLYNGNDYGRTGFGLAVREK